MARYPETKRGVGAVNKHVAFSVLLSFILATAVVNVGHAEAPLMPVQETTSSLFFPAPCNFFFDDFSDTGSGWPTYVADNYDIGYEDDQYKMWMDTRVFWIRNAHTSCGNPHIEVDTSLYDYTNPPPPPYHNIRYGILFRYADTNNWYAFEVSHDGYFRVSKRVEGTFSDVIPWTYSDSIHPGLADNHLAVDALGTRISVGANGQTLATTSDTSHSFGFAGLMAGTSVDQSVWVYFDNFLQRGHRRIAIDIKPGSDPNCVNINSHGVIPVAILGDRFFDVRRIDTHSLLFGGLEVRIRGNKRPQCAVEDVNGDSRDDLVCHFEDDAENWEAGDDTATLTGMLDDGTLFEGTDSICLVP
jgi:hypothetical protein